MEGEVLISATRLRLASARALPPFLWHSLGAVRQARAAPGFRGLRLLADRRLTFWTATAWTDLAAMKRYRSTGEHRAAMPLMAGWCDEGAVVRWSGPLAALADWPAIHARLLAEGEPSRVVRPSPDQLARAWPRPRLNRFRELVVKPPGWPPLRAVPGRSGMPAGPRAP